MPIDWRATLGALDQDTAAILARRKLEQEGLLSVIKEADQLKTNEVNRRTNEETRAANAANRRVATENLQQGMADRLMTDLGPDADITNNPKAQQVLAAAGRNVTRTPGIPQQSVSVTSPRDLGAVAPGLATDVEGAPAAPPEGTTDASGQPTLLDGIQQAVQQSGEKPKVMTQGTYKQRQEQQKVKDIYDFSQMEDGEEKNNLRTKLQLQYGITSKMFGDQEQLITVGPDGKPQLVGTVSPGSRIVKIPGGQNAADAGKISDDLLTSMAMTVGKNGLSFSKLSLPRGAYGEAVRQRIFDKMGDLIATGVLDPDFATNGVEMAAAAKTYSQLQSKYAMIDKAAMDARDNLRLALESSSAVDRQGIKTDSAYLNEHIIPFLQGLTPNPGLSDFQTKLYTGLREYVKVANGSAASIAEPSNQAIKDATGLLNKFKSSEDIVATIGAINQDISVVENNNKRMLTSVLNKIKSVGRGPGPDAAAPPAAAPPAAAPVAAPPAAVVPTAAAPAPGAPSQMIKVGDHIKDKDGNIYPVTGNGRLPDGFTVVGK